MELMALSCKHRNNHPTGLKHRNLRTKMHMFARVLQLFLEKQLVKKLTSTTDKVIYFKETIFQGSSSKHLFTSQSRVEIS
jgi:hypothetical protein